MKKLVAVVLMLLCLGVAAAGAEEVMTAADLQTAISNGGVVKLGGDIDLGTMVLTFPDNTPVTVDLNGHVLQKSMTGYVLELGENDAVTITDGVGTGSVEKAGGWYFFKNDSAFLRIEGGTYSKSGYDLVYASGTAETEIAGGTFELDNLIARQSDDSQATITNGTFTVNNIATGLWDRGTAVTGGTFSIDPRDFVDVNQYVITTNTDHTYTVSEKPVTYSVTVISGTAAKAEYPQGDTVTITANVPADGWKFTGWTSEDGVVFDNASASATTFIMPGKAVAVKANYKAMEYVTLNLKSPRGMKETLTIDIDATVADLKAAVAEKCGITFGGSSEYRLFGENLKYPNSRLADDTKVLRDIGFASNQTIHLEKNTNWDASGSEAIKIFGLSITGGKGSQEPYGDYNNVDYYWNYFYKTITIKSTANITISGTGEEDTDIIIKKAGNSAYTNLTISDLHLTTTKGACINVQGNSWVKLTAKGNNTLTATGTAAEYTVDKMPALTLTNSGAYLKIMGASTGTLTATTRIAGQPGIGTYDNTSSVWGVEINGGTIIANGGENAAGIRAQTVCVYGGNVTANGGIEGYGTNALYPHSIEILGGTVTASSESGKALSAAANLENYESYKATASSQANGMNAQKYDAASNDTYHYFHIEPATAYTISAEAENGTVTVSASQAFEGDTITLMLAPNVGYTLVSLTVKQGEHDVTVSGEGNTRTFLMPAGDVTVTASFFDFERVVTFDPNGGEGTMEPQTLIWGKEDQFLRRNSFTREGYRFVAWNTMADGSGEEYSDGAVVAAVYNCTLYAQWQPLPTVRISVPSGIGGGSFHPGDTVTITAKLSEGKTFVEWLGLDGVEILSGSKNTPTITIRVPDHDMTLLVRWTKESEVLPGGPSAQPPVTGDETPVAQWMALMLLSLFGVFSLQRRKTN